MTAINFSVQSEAQEMKLDGHRSMQKDMFKPASVRKVLQNKLRLS